MLLPRLTRCKRLFIFALFSALSISMLQASTLPTASNSANIFEFHSGFWINLHHFLYLEAQLSEAGAGARYPSLTAADKDELQRLSPAEQATWAEAVSFYKDSFTNKDLLFDDNLIEIKNLLEDAEQSSDLAQTQIPTPLKAVLLKAAPIYRAHWWRRHDEQNQRWIADLQPLVDRYGRSLVADLVAIYAQPWPQYPVRVDAVAYANWAGAYTTVGPTRPAISSTDPANQENAALEIVFHETSHGMMDKIMEAFQKAEQEVNAHRQGAPFHAGTLWHAVLFYTAGALVAKRIPGYEPYADKHGLWIRAWPDPDRVLIAKDWGPHVDGKTDLQSAITRLVADLASAPRR